MFDLNTRERFHFNHYQYLCNEGRDQLDVEEYQAQLNRIPTLYQKAFNAVADLMQQSHAQPRLNINFDQPQPSDAVPMQFLGLALQMTKQPEEWEDLSKDEKKVLAHLISFNALNQERGNEIDKGANKLYGFCLDLGRCLTPLAGQFSIPLNLCILGAKQLLPTMAQQGELGISEAQAKVLFTDRFKEPSFLDEYKQLKFTPQALNYVVNEILVGHQDELDRIRNEVKSAQPHAPEAEINAKAEQRITNICINLMTINEYHQEAKEEVADVAGLLIKHEELEKLTIEPVATQPEKQHKVQAIILDMARIGGQVALQLQANARQAQGINDLRGRVVNDANNRRQADEHAGARDRIALAQHNTPHFREHAVLPGQLILNPYKREELAKVYSDEIATISKRIHRDDKTVATLEQRTKRLLKLEEQTLRHIKRHSGSARSSLVGSAVSIGKGLSTILPGAQVALPFLEAGDGFLQFFQQRHLDRKQSHLLRHQRQIERFHAAALESQRFGVQLKQHNAVLQQKLNEFENKLLILQGATKPECIEEKIKSVRDKKKKINADITSLSNQEKTAKEKLEKKKAKELKKAEKKHGVTLDSLRKRLAKVNLKNEREKLAKLHKTYEKDPSKKNKRAYEHQKYRVEVFLPGIKKGIKTQIKNINDTVSGNVAEDALVVTGISQEKRALEDLHKDYNNEQKSLEKQLEDANKYKNLNVYWEEQKKLLLGDPNRYAEILAGQYQEYEAIMAPIRQTLNQTFGEVNSLLNNLAQLAGPHSKSFAPAIKAASVLLAGAQHSMTGVLEICKFANFVGLLNQNVDNKTFWQKFIEGGVTSWLGVGMPMLVLANLGLKFFVAAKNKFQPVKSAELQGIEHVAKELQKIGEAQNSGFRILDGQIVNGFNGINKILGEGFCSIHEVIVRVANSSQQMLEQTTHQLLEDLYVIQNKVSGIDQNLIYAIESHRESFQTLMTQINEVDQHLSTRIDTAAANEFTSRLSDYCSKIIALGETQQREIQQFDDKLLRPELERVSLWTDLLHTLNAHAKRASANDCNGMVSPLTSQLMGMTKSIMPALALIAYVPEHFSQYLAAQVSQHLVRVPNLQLFNNTLERLVTLVEEIDETLAVEQSPAKTKHYIDLIHSKPMQELLQHCNSVYQLVQELHTNPNWLQACYARQQNSLAQLQPIVSAAAKKRRAVATIAEPVPTNFLADEYYKSIFASRYAVLRLLHHSYKFSTMNASILHGLFSNPDGILRHTEFDATKKHFIYPDGDNLLCKNEQDDTGRPTDKDWVVRYQPKANNAGFEVHMWYYEQFIHLVHNAKARVESSGVVIPDRIDIAYFHRFLQMISMPGGTDYTSPVIIDTFAERFNAAYTAYKNELVAYERNVPGHLNYQHELLNNPTTNLRNQLQSYAIKSNKYLPLLLPYNYLMFLKQNHYIQFLYEAANEGLGKLQAYYEFNKVNNEYVLNLHYRFTLEHGIPQDCMIVRLATFDAGTVQTFMHTQWMDKFVPNQYKGQNHADVAINIFLIMAMGINQQALLPGINTINLNAVGQPDILFADDHAFVGLYSIFNKLRGKTFCFQSGRYNNESQQSITNYVQNPAAELPPEFVKEEGYIRLCPGFQSVKKAYSQATINRAHNTRMQLENSQPYLQTMKDLYQNYESALAIFTMLTGPHISLAESFCEQAGLINPQLLDARYVTEFTELASLFETTQQQVFNRKSAVELLDQIRLLTSSTVGVIFNQVEALYTLLEKYLLNRAEELVSQHENKQAFICYQQLHLYFPKDLNYLSKMALCLGARNKNTDTLPIYNQLIELSVREDKNHASYLYRRGCAYQVLGEHRKAIADFDRAHVIDTVEIDYLFARAKSYLHLADPTKALQDLQRIIALDDEFIPAHIICGDIEMTARNYEQAIEHFTQALDRETTVDVHWRRAQAFAAAEKGTCALLDLQAIAELQPNFTEREEYLKFREECVRLAVKTYVNLAEYSTSTNEPARALVYLNQAISLQANNMALHAEKDKVLRRLSQTTEGLTLFNRRGNSATEQTADSFAKLPEYDSLHKLG